MQRVTGIGGVFLRARDPAALAAWYAEHLGLDVEDWHGAVLRSAGGETLVWAQFPAETEYFGRPRPAGDGQLPRRRSRGDARAAARRRRRRRGADEDTRTDASAGEPIPKGTASSSGSRAPATASEYEGTVRKCHLAERAARRHADDVPELTDREVLEAILTSSQYVHVKLDHILEYFGEDGEEEEDETDG